MCLEPWIGRCDNVGFDGELKDKYGEQHLKAGENFQAGYSEKNTIPVLRGLKFYGFFTIISIKPKKRM